MKVEVSSGIVVFKRNAGTKKYLLLERTEGFLDFPKGHIEKGETDIEAAIRETREESGLDVEPIKEFRREMDYWFRAPIRKGQKDREFMEASEYAKKRGSGELVHKTLIMFVGEVRDNQKPEISFEHTGYRWLSYDEAMGLLRYGNQKELLQEVEQFLNSR